MASDKEINYLANQIKTRINSLASEYFKHSMQIQHDEDNYDHHAYIGDCGPSVSLQYGPAVSVIPGQQL